MENLVKFQKREIDRKIKVWGLVFRKLFRPVIADQEVRILQRVPLLEKPTLKKIMDLDYENKVVALAMRPVYITVTTEEAENFLGRIGIFVKSVRPKLLLDEKIFKYADKYSFAMAKYVNKTTTRRIKGEILSGLKKKLTWSKIATNIKKNVFKDLSMGYRSKMIARTEAHGMVENGSYEAAKASKIMKEKTWSSGADARPTHTDAHNQTVLLHDHFYVGGYLLDFPGDTSLGASMEEIIHCRCSVMYSSKIHKKRLTTSQKLATEYKFKEEHKKYKKLFDQYSIKEGAKATKERIVGRIGEKLVDNKDFKHYVMEQYSLTEKGFAELPFMNTNLAVDDLIKQWGMTSGDFNPTAIAMQMAAGAEFGLTKAAFEHYAKDIVFRANQIFRANGKAFKAFLRAQYNITQEFLKKNGIKSITSYRGMTFMPGKEPKEYIFGLDLKVVKGKLQLQPMSSFSTSLETADLFASTGTRKMVVQIEVPAKKILSTCQTGYGCKEELELVIVGGKQTVKIATFGGKVSPSLEEIFKTFEVIK